MLLPMSARWIAERRGRLSRHEPVIIGTPSSGLSVHALKRGPRGVAEEALVRLSQPGLHAERWVWASDGDGFDRLTDFFAGMNDDWRGWTGERTWEALEGELELTARHDGGHIQIDVMLQEGESPGVV